MITEAYSIGLLHISACTNDTDDEMLAKVENLYPSGTADGWKIADEPFADGSPNPSPRNDDLSRRHVLVAC